MSRFLALILFAFATQSAASDTRFSFVQAERLEYREAPDDALWDIQGWYGGDLDKLWLKTEGEARDGNVRHAEVQALYSRAWTAFFDLQFGVRLSEIDDGDLLSVVAGVQGMAPYRIETDAALFVSEDGDLSLRTEFERDILLGEQLILQPRAELSIAFQDVPEIAVGSGLSELSVGLRLRYEVTRKFAPYLGIEWQKQFGKTADFRRFASESTDETSLVAGLRFWF